VCAVRHSASAERKSPSKLNNESTFFPTLEKKHVVKFYAVLPTH